MIMLTAQTCIHFNRQTGNKQMELTDRQTDRHSKTSFEKNCFSAWASTLNMGLINKVDMVCLSPVG